ncbi:hypothetical protein FCM35_KLT00524 [Carex littledalei]|uniref:Uncharacterized protein n=1 Tax=Carex littledalei TaxID=544730 RepID=A0A833RU87_9POAL|nr:hypothetical protein FCM35_KLT00524 [Carex littledalei]
MDTEIELTSAAENPETGLTPAATEIELTSAAAKSIFRAPSQIRYSRESDFEPKLVSIGPYYDGRENFKREHLEGMDHFKFRCIADLLRSRAAGSSNTDSVPTEPFMEFELPARNFYKDEFNLPGVKFVEMLIRDSCFIIRIILSLSDHEELSMPFLDVNIKEVRSDLLLLENQIPLFFIWKMFDWLFGDNLQSEFETALLMFINLDMPLRTNLGGMPTNFREMSSKAAHLLDLCWILLGDQHDFEDHRFQKEQFRWRETYASINQSKVMENATLLHQTAGIKFKKLNSPRVNGLNVYFSNGIMRMPWLKIDSNQTTLLVNLIAFEDCIHPNKQTVSPYMKLMDALIDSAKDVELLQQCGVISNSLSSHKMAATFFNDIGNFCLIHNNLFLFSDLYKDVQKYYNSIWNRSVAILRQKYFSNPWSYISVGAGTFLLIFAAVQTHYVVYPTHNCC